MADFDLTQTDAQVQSILNDAQDAQGAGAQTTLTNDYIMLKGTNGRYHKIQKESFTEAVRNTLASLLVNNDKGTTISQIAAIASGDFGSVTPANLASVLGAFGSMEVITSTTSLDNLRNTGIYYWPSTGNGPTGSPLTDGAGIAVVIRFNSSLTLQVVFAASTTDQQYSTQSFMNVRVYNGGDWRPFVKVAKN